MSHIKIEAVIRGLTQTLVGPTGPLNYTVGALIQHSIALLQWGFFSFSTQASLSINNNSVYSKKITIVFLTFESWQHCCSHTAIVSWNIVQQKKLRLDALYDKVVMPRDNYTAVFLAFLLVITIIHDYSFVAIDVTNWNGSTMPELRRQLNTVHWKHRISKWDPITIPTEQSIALV